MGVVVCVVDAAAAAAGPAVAAVRGRARCGRRQLARGDERLDLARQGAVGAALAQGAGADGACIRGAGAAHLALGALVEEHHLGLVDDVGLRQYSSAGQQAVQGGRCQMESAEII